MGSEGRVGRLVTDAERMLLCHTLSLAQLATSFVVGRRPRRGKARPPELPAFLSPFLYLPALRWIANLLLEFVGPFGVLRFQCSYLTFGLRTGLSSNAHSGTNYFFHQGHSCCNHGAFKGARRVRGKAIAPLTRAKVALCDSRIS